MRKVKFKSTKYDKETRSYPVIDGLFHGFHICSWHDGDKNVQWTAAIIEDTEGRMHKVEPDEFRFLDKPNQGEKLESSATQQVQNQGSTV
jgi:hypothetical protein